MQNFIPWRTLAPHLEQILSTGASGVLKEDGAVPTGAPHLVQNLELEESVAPHLLQYTSIRGGGFIGGEDLGGGGCDTLDASGCGTGFVVGLSFGGGGDAT